MLEEGRLRALLAISEHGGSSGAARALGRPVTEVTGHVSDWERDLGLPLVDGDRLTPAGRRLAEHAGALLGQLESAESDAAAVAGRAAGTLRLGVGADAGRVLLPEVLAALRSTELSLHVRQLPEERVDALDSTLDAVLVGTYGAAVPHRPDPAVERRELLTEPLLLAVPTRHRATGASVRLADLSGETWVGRTGDALVALERAAAGAGFAPRLGAEVGEDALALTLVAAGLGVALVPASAAPATVDGVRFLTVLDGGLRRTVLAAVRRSRIADPGVQQVLDALTAAARRVAAAVPGVTAAITPTSGGAARRPDPLLDPLPPDGAPRSNGRRDPWADRARTDPNGTEVPPRNGSNGSNGLGPTGTELPGRNGTAAYGPGGTELPGRNGAPGARREPDELSRFGDVTPGSLRPTDGPAGGLPPAPGRPDDLSRFAGDGPAGDLRPGEDLSRFAGAPDSSGARPADDRQTPPTGSRRGAPRSDDATRFAGPGAGTRPDDASRLGAPDPRPEDPARSGASGGGHRSEDAPRFGGPGTAPRPDDAARFAGPGAGTRPDDAARFGAPDPRLEDPARSGGSGGGHRSEDAARFGDSRSGDGALSGGAGARPEDAGRSGAARPGEGARAGAAPGAGDLPRRPASADPNDLSGLSGLAGFGAPRPGPRRPDPGALPGPNGAVGDDARPAPDAPPLPPPGAGLPSRGGSSPYRTPPPTGDDPGFTPELPGRGPNPYRADTSAHPAPDPFRGSNGTDGPNPYRSNGQSSGLFTAAQRPDAAARAAEPPPAGRRARVRGGDSEGTLPPAPAGAVEDVRLSIFEDLQSEWFVQRPDGEQSPTWQSSADDGWAAAARLAEPTTAGTTTAGLPRRRPQAMAMPGAVGGSAASGGETPAQQSTTHRSPQEVRGRLSSYRDGVRRGRHAERPSDERE